jgi:hypothetical protein
MDGFRGALKTDPSCGMANWGVAVSMWGNPFIPDLRDISQLREGQAAAQAAADTGAKTERERAYIAAVARLYEGFEHVPQPIRLLRYRDAMADVADRYPEDHEAAIFYALALVVSEEPTDKSYSSRLKAGAMLEKLFAKQPNHPGLAHYIIHAYDVSTLATRALPAAGRYAAIAPDAPHALHMPSHTFTRVGDWPDSIGSNVAAAAAARRDRQTSEELHADDYLVYALLQSGRDHSARALVTALPDVEARFDPKRTPLGAAPASAAYFAIAAIPARFALEREDWRAAAQLPLRDSPIPYADAVTYFARGLGAAHLGDAAGMQASAEALSKIERQLREANNTYWAEQVAIQRMAVVAWTEVANHDEQHALKDMIAAADREDAIEKSAITPGPLKPAREMLGELYLRMNQPEMALMQFTKTLQNEPNRFRALYGAARSAQTLGDQVASERYGRRLLLICAHGDQPGRAELAEAAALVRTELRRE